MAEKERFELSRRYSRPTPLAGAPLRPLEYFSVYSLAGCRFLLPADITYYTQFFPLCQYLFAILSVAFCGFFAFLFFELPTVVENIGWGRENFEKHRPGHESFERRCLGARFAENRDHIAQSKCQDDSTNLRIRGVSAPSMQPRP